jgi:hypothetical protein
MASLVNAEFRYWRTDTKRHSREIYALVYNDPAKPSPHDPLIGTMETADLAEIVVEVHNNAIRKYGKRYLKVLQSDG